MRVEIEEKSQDTPLEGTLKPLLSLPRPLFIDNFESNVLVGGSSMEPDDCKFLRIRRLEEELGGLCHINQVWVEHVELVPLHNFWGWVVVIVVGLVVLVPVVPCFDPVEVAGL